MFDTVATQAPEHEMKAGIVYFEFFKVNIDFTKLRLITRHLILYKVYTMSDRTY